MQLERASSSMPHKITEAGRQAGRVVAQLLAPDQYLAASMQHHAAGTSAAQTHRAPNSVARSRKQAVSAHSVLLCDIGGCSLMPTAIGWQVMYLGHAYNGQHGRQTPARNGSITAAWPESPVSSANRFATAPQGRAGVRCWLLPPQACSASICYRTAYGPTGHPQRPFIRQIMVHAGVGGWACDP